MKKVLSKAIGYGIVFFCLLSPVIYIIFAPDIVAPRSIINNSGEQIIIEREGESLVVAHGEAGTLLPKETLDFCIRRADGTRFNYRWQPFPWYDYIISNHIYLQLEPDFRVYLLREASKSIVHELPKQPEMWPLIPQNSP
ncbi:MAG: hypothetical protein NZO58_02405 [Gemmataceae bacterium]|nr:hypothetical protein [Gemmataceae bacterium]